MASLTVRQLDEALKKRLRLRAARNGRSVEDEVRTILRSAAADGESFAAAPETDAAARPATKSDSAARKALLIIGGGIAAYKSLDLIRRLRERGIAVRVVMTDAAQKFITPLSAGALAGEPPFTDLFDTKLEFDVGHIRLARDTEHRDRRARDRRPDGQDGERPRRRSRLGGAARDRPDDPARAGDEPEDVVEQGDACGTWRSFGPTACSWSVRTPARWRRATRPASAAWPSRWRSSPPPRRCWRPRPASLAGLRMIVTSGPTHEPIDPVRYIANRSSGKQGHAIAEAAAAPARTSRWCPGRSTCPIPRA